MTTVLPPASDKPRFVADMFGRIARRYDLMNTLMTFGQDARWRRQVAEAVSGCATVLDVGTGTGRLAETIAGADPSARVVGVDFAQPMLRIARGRGVAVSRADALQLPFADEQFDAVVSAFLVRNLADIERGVAEQVRVLRPGGWLVILETTPGPPGPVKPLFRIYFRRLVPLLGNVIARDASAYTYLPESTLAFVEPGRLARLLREIGLRDVCTQRLGLGSVAVTRGRKVDFGPS